MKCTLANDWIRAMKYYNESAQAYGILYGKQDNKYIYCLNGYEMAKKKRQETSIKQDKLPPSSSNEDGNNNNDMIENVKISDLLAVEKGGKLEGKQSP